MPNDVVTRGGLAAHLFRRSFHIATCFYPWIIYQIIYFIQKYVDISSFGILLIFMLVLIFLECLRLALHWRIWGMRQYESKQFSALFWGFFGLLIVIGLVPGGVESGRKYVYPIVCGFAFVDPLVGELRKLKMHKGLIWIIGLLVTAGIWFVASYWLGTPIWLMYVMPFLVMIAEWPSLSWVDDNFLLQILPLLFLILCNHWF